MITSRDLYREQPRDPLATYIGRPAPKQAPPPKLEVDVYQDISIVTKGMVIITVKLKAYDIHSGEIVRSAEHQTANYGDYRSFARIKTLEFVDELRNDNFEIRKTVY